MTTTYAWGATGMRQIDDPEKVNVAFVQHEDFARAEAEVAILRNDLATYAERIAALEAERDALQGECERLSDAARLATIDLAGVAELQRDSRRLHWLHSQASCKPDIQGCEWGIWRVSWEGGRASHVWATNSDFSDLDAAMQLAEDYAAIDAAREKP